MALRQWRGRAISRWIAVTLATHPTTNPFLTNSKKSDDRNVLQTHINTVQARTFPTVHAATPRAMQNGILCGAKIEISSLII